jgi:hypothetical protein
MGDELKTTFRALLAGATDHDRPLIRACMAHLGFAATEIDKPVAMADVSDARARLLNGS